MNLSLSNKNPFSTFDFLGYFFPGALFAGIFYLFTDRLSFGGELIPPLFIDLKIYVSTHIGVGVFLSILLCYVTGHLLSYASSITVELFYTWCYGYPTRYLLRKDDTEHKKQYLLNSDFDFAGMLGHLIVCLFLFPIVVGYLFFERLLNMKRFIGKKLDDKLIDGISKKVGLICNSIGYKDASVSDVDVHRVVMHYVYEHCQMHQVKFDNYVALYGLLRSVAFVFCLSFIFQILRLFYSHPLPDTEVLRIIVPCVQIGVIFFLSLIIILFPIKIKAKKDHVVKVIKIIDVLFVIFMSGLGILAIFFIAFMANYTNISGEIMQLCFMFIATYISYLGFAKFYRRFTLENFMAILICEIPQSKDGLVRLSTKEPLHIKIDHPTSVIAELIRAIWPIK